MIDSPPGMNFFHDYGQATWTDLARIGECRRAVHEYTETLRRLRAGNANPMDIIIEKIAIQGAHWQLEQLESKFRIHPNHF